ncbi:hypothetical protein [Nocardia bhagyanarayanae]|uniref:WD domain G-beta repeat uncharacterized protein n=1 Tax=Nocardia bhagyanarayanae TaxID=1215925 RepID=A0A543FFF4_9NOCA|nr:hypothetical protein [Nocardia bhagyanarayanae]TQM32502.1 WD domain G-beta repeat uncharacterized protein [Nocardia bhagyanarayanae]
MDPTLGIPDQERLRAELVPREWITSRLRSWLTSGERVLLITGPPGTGKTWFAAQLALQRTLDPRTDPRVVELPSTATLYAHFCDGNDERTLDTGEFVAQLSLFLAREIPGFHRALASSVESTGIHLSINATQTIGSMQSNATATNVEIHLAGAISARRAFTVLVRRPLEVVAAAGWDGQVLVVVDDLSSGYHYDTRDNIAELIGSVASDTSGPAGLRFVVTSRPDPWVLKALPVAAVDLHDDSPDRDDLITYIRGRLPTVEDTLRTALARILSIVVDGNFLFARHLLDDLAHPVEAGAIDPRSFQFPTGLTDLYQRWVASSLARSRERWWGWQQPVLAALAVARAAGFTETQLAGITGLPMSKVRYALDECAQFLLRDTDTGQVRIYHNSFREFLTLEHVHSEEAHHAIVEFFVRNYADRWHEADPYCRLHLVVHAAAAGQLGALVTYADFLVAVEPTALLRELPALPRGHRHAEVFARVGRLLADLDPGQRAAQLELAALEIGARDIADQFSRLTLVRAWRPLWVESVRHTPSTFIGAHPLGVLDLLALRRFGADVVATLGVDDTLRLWDLSAQDAQGELQLTSSGSPARLALLTLEGGEYLMVTGSVSVTLVHLDRLEAVASIPTRPDVLITASTVVVLDSGDAAVLGYADGVIEVVHPVGGAVLAGPWHAHDGPVFTLSSPSPYLVISGGAEGTVSLWFVSADAAERADSSGPLWSASPGCWSRAVKSVQVSDTDRMLAVGHSDGRVHLIALSDDPAYLEVCDHLPASQRHRYFQLMFMDGIPMQLTSGGSGSNDFRDVQRDSVGHGSRYPSEGITTVFGGVNCLDLMHVDDRVHLVSAGEDGKIVYLVTDPNFVAHAGIVLPYGRPLGAVAFAETAHGHVLLSAESSGSGVIRAWPLAATPWPLAPTVGEFRKRIRAMDAIVDADGTLVVVVVDDDHIGVRVGSAAWSFHAAQLTVHTVRMWIDDTHLWIAASGRADDDGAVRLWQISRDAEPIEFTLTFPELLHVAGVAQIQDDGDFLTVVGTRRGGGPAVMVVSSAEGHWVGRDVPLDGIPPECDLIDWTSAITGSGGREVLLSGAGRLHRVSVEHGVLGTDHSLFAGPRPTSIHTAHGAALVHGCWSDITIESLDENLYLANLHIEPHGEITSIAALPDGTTVAAGTTDGRVALWHDFPIDPAPLLSATDTTERPRSAESRAPNQVIRLPSAVLQLVVQPDEMILASTDLGIYVLQVRRSPSDDS